MKVTRRTVLRKEKINVEDDFYLENDGDPEEFLATNKKNKDVSLHLDSLGNIAPFSLVGDVKLYKVFNQRLNQNKS